MSERLLKSEPPQPIAAAKCLLVNHDSSLHSKAVGILKQVTEVNSKLRVIKIIAFPGNLDIADLRSHHRGLNSFVYKLALVTIPASELLCQVSFYIRIFRTLTTMISSA